MEAKIIIDFNEFSDENGKNLEHVLSDALKREILKNAKNELISEKFKEFSEKVSEAIVSEAKLRMKNFLDEEIVLTAGWGEKTFVGSVEDLIKMRFDDIILRPVSDRGETLKGCTSSGKTWIEWSIEKQLGDSLKRIIDAASKTIIDTVSKSVNTQLAELKDKTIKKQVGEAFAAILTK